MVTPGSRWTGAAQRWAHANEVIDVRILDDLVTGGRTPTFIIDPDQFEALAPPASTVSQVNKVPAPLGANEMFVGEWEEMSEFSAIHVIFRTDQWSAINGAIAQFSLDGLSVTRQISTTIPGGSNGGSLLFAPLAKFFRIVYLNGGIAQTEFENETSYHRTVQQPTSLMLPQPLDDRYSAIITRAIIAGKNPAGAYVNLEVTEDGELRQAITRFDAEMPIKALTSFRTGQWNVTDSPTQIAVSPLDGRKTISVRALAGNTQPVYIGTDDTVAVTTGFPLYAGDAVELEVNEATQIWALSESGTQRVAHLAVA
jgi:hypothetical protein